MTPRLPSVTARKIIRALEKKGFALERRQRKGGAHHTALSLNFEF